MNSDGYHSIHLFLSSQYRGMPEFSFAIVEKGTIPASSQGFPTSGTLSVNSLHLEHLILTSSIHGLWGECPSNFSQPSTAFPFSSSIPPIISKLPHFLHSQIGRARPQ